MRRLMACSGLIALFVAASAIAAEPQQNRGPWGHWGQFWGTWVWTTNNRLPGLVTFQFDGTMVVSDGSMFGGIIPNSTTRMTPLHGLWERTGLQSIGGTSLWLIFDSNTGMIMGWGRSRSTLQFADNFDHLQGKMFVETLACAAGPPVSCPDPLDSAVKWVANPNMPQDGFPVSATRLERVEAGPIQP